MDPNQVDRISRFFATRHLSRRQAIQQGAAGLAAAGLAATGLKAAAAQESTPTAEAGETPATEFLFVQSFQSGTIAPKEGADGTYTLTLQHGLGQTIYFSDRPERIVGAGPTPRFLDSLGFGAGNPPNAALVVETAPGETDLAVVELFDPVYDEANRTLTYEVEVLEEWEDALGLGLTEEPADLAAFGDSFGATHLFIDGCPYGTGQCIRDGAVVWTLPGNTFMCIGSGSQAGQCVVCPSTVDTCNRTRQCSSDLGGKGYCTVNIVY